MRANGIPRFINALCDNMLLNAFAVETKTCNLDMLDEVCKDMRLEWPGSPADAIPRPPTRATSARHTSLVCS